MAFELFKNDIRIKKNKIFIGNFNFKKKYNFKVFYIIFLSILIDHLQKRIVIE